MAARAWYRSARVCSSLGSRFSIRPFRRREKKQRMLKNSWYDRWESSNRGDRDRWCTSVFQIRERTPYFVFIVLLSIPIALDPLHRSRPTDKRSISNSFPADKEDEPSSTTIHFPDIILYTSLPFLWITPVSSATISFVKNFRDDQVLWIIQNAKDAYINSAWCRFLDPKKEKNQSLSLYREKITQVSRKWIIPPPLLLSETIMWLDSRAENSMRKWRARNARDRGFTGGRDSHNRIEGGVRASLQHFSRVGV